VRILWLPMRRVVVMTAFRCSSNLAFRRDVRPHPPTVTTRVKTHCTKSFPPTATKHITPVTAGTPLPDRETPIDHRPEKTNRTLPYQPTSAPHHLPHHPYSPATPESKCSTVDRSVSTSAVVGEDPNPPN